MNERKLKVRPLGLERHRWGSVSNGFEYGAEALDEYVEMLKEGNTGLGESHRDKYMALNVDGGTIPIAQGIVDEYDAVMVMTPYLGGEEESGILPESQVLSSYEELSGVRVRALSPAVFARARPLRLFCEGCLSEGVVSRLTGAPLKTLLSTTEKEKEGEVFLFFLLFLSVVFLFVVFLFVVLLFCSFCCLSFCYFDGLCGRIY